MAICFERVHGRERIDTVIQDPKTKGYWAAKGDALFSVDQQTGANLPVPDKLLTEAVANLQKRAALADVSVDPLKAANLLLEVGQKGWAELIRSAASAGQIQAAANLKAEDAFLLATKTNFETRQRK